MNDGLAGTKQKSSVFTMFFESIITETIRNFYEWNTRAPSFHILINAKEAKKKNEKILWKPNSFYVLFICYGSVKLILCPFLNTNISFTYFLNILCSNVMHFSMDEPFSHTRTYTNEQIGKIHQYINGAEKGKIVSWYWTYGDKAMYIIFEIHSQIRWMCEYTTKYSFQSI